MKSIDNIFETYDVNEQECREFGSRYDLAVHLQEMAQFWGLLETDDDVARDAANLWEWLNETRDE